MKQQVKASTAVHSLYTYDLISAVSYDWWNSWSGTESIIVSLCQSSHTQGFVEQTIKQKAWFSKKPVLFKWIREGTWRRDISTSPKKNSYVYDYPKKKIKSRKIQQLSIFIQYYIANNVGWSTIFSFHKANIIKLICNTCMYNMFCYNKIQIQKYVNSHLAIVET